VRTFHSRCLAVEVDVSLTSARVVGVIEQLVIARGAPAAITVDNGSKFYSRRTRGPNQPRLWLPVNRSSPP
jgi:hypothetical protein